MYDIVKKVILSGRFELTDMLRKLDTLWVQGDLTDDQRTELMALAREKADPAISSSLRRQVEDHETRIRAIEDAMQGGEQLPAPPAGEWPEFVTGKNYLNGDKVTFKGKRYICTLPEHTTTCVWSPEDYPAYWQEAA